MHPVYPRLRGERIFNTAAVIAVVGLSPATRGTLHGRSDSAVAGRFIPGYAGNASVFWLTLDCPAVYPRLRGERLNIAVISKLLNGLSPATRGTPYPEQLIVTQGRFIPGYAGNAAPTAAPACLFSVYPRLRGER